MQEPSKPHEPSTGAGAPPKTPETPKVEAAQSSEPPSKPADVPRPREVASAGATPRPDMPKLVSTAKPFETPPGQTGARPVEAAKGSEASKSSESLRSEPHKAAASHGGNSSALVESPAKALVLVAGATAILIALIWNFMGTPSPDQATLEDTRAKLKSVTTELNSVKEAKAQADKALADTQAKLTAEQKLRATAEKAVSDAKAALGAVGPVAAPEGAAKSADKPADAAKAAAPKPAAPK